MAGFSCAAGVGGCDPEGLADGSPPAPDFRSDMVMRAKCHKFTQIDKQFTFGVSRVRPTRPTYSNIHTSNSTVSTGVHDILTSAAARSTSLATLYRPSVVRCYHLRSPAPPQALARTHTQTEVTSKPAELEPPRNGLTGHVTKGVDWKRQCCLSWKSSLLEYSTWLLHLSSRERFSVCWSQRKLH